MNPKLAPLLKAAAQPEAGAAEIAVLVEAAAGREDPLASLIETLASSPVQSDELIWHEVLAEHHVSPGSNTWKGCAEAFDTLAQEPEVLAALARLLEVHPWPAWTRQVTKPWVERFLDPAAKHGALALFRGLDFAVAGVDPEAFAGTPHAQHLTHLRIAQDFIADAWRSIASNPHLLGISHLILHGGGEDAPLLLLEAQLPALRYLDLASCDLDDQAIEALAERGVLARLGHLDLGENPDWGPNSISSRGVVSLAAAAPALHYLDLSGNAEVDDEGVLALCSAPAATKLRTLHLSGITLGAPALEALARLEHLEVLTLGPVGAKGLQLLGAGAGLRALRALSVWPEDDEDLDLREEGLSRLRAALPALEQLRS